MITIQLRTIDSLTQDDDDTWIEACIRCGTSENHGELVCDRCDD